MTWPVAENTSLVPLKHACRMNPETLPEITASDYAFDYIDIGSVTLEAGIVGRESMIFANAPSRARKPVRTGDVIISTVRTYLKAVASIGPEANGCIASTGFAVLRAKAGVDPRFLYRVVQSNPFVEAVVAASSGVSFPAINPSTLASIKIPLPALDTQKTVAAFLDREISRIDLLITKKERVVELLHAKKVWIIANAVRHGLDSTARTKSVSDDWLGNVPAHWRSTRLKHLFRQRKRQGYPDQEVLSVYRDYGVIIKASRDDNINKTPEDLSLYQLVNPGDLVVNKMKAWQGSLGISAVRGITSPDYMVFDPLVPQFPRFMHHYLRAQPMPSVYRSMSNGIRPDQWRMEPEKFRDIIVWLPNYDEQVTISAYIDRETAVIDKLIELTALSMERLREHRGALITASVTGQIDVRQLSTVMVAKRDRSRFRVIVGAEVVQRHQGNARFGRVKLQKELYLAEAHAGIVELQGTYFREAAGPLDRTLVEETERGMEASAFSRATLPDIHAKNGGVAYSPLPKAGQHRAELEALLGPRAKALRDLIELLRDLDTWAVEALATLYAVWNDALIDGESPGDDAIVHAVLTDWHPQKRDKFKDADLRHWLAWMKRNGLVPRGKGPRTISTMSRDMFA